jgi:hypothetical protein
MDVSTLGSLRRRVPILNEEYYNAWKHEMLDIFDEFNLNKYIHNPYVPPIDLLHPTHEEEIGMLRNLRTINLTIRGLPKIVLGCMQNFECAYTLWRDLEKRYPDYSLKNLDEILHKTIAFHKMSPSDPNFDDCLFELKEMLELLATLSRKPLEFINLNIVMIMKLMNSLA